MSKYRINSLGDVEFENLIQSLLKRVIGPGTTTFGAGKDGAREATFSGEAPYPSITERWSGKWVFQVKYHDIELVGTPSARSSVISDIDNELKKLTTKYEYSVNNYILVTNVPLSGVHRRGTLDRIESEVFNKYREKIPNLAVWGADDVNRFLDLYPEVRRSYVHLLITGDVVAELLTRNDEERSERATTIDMYLRTAISREANAQLDQAGDVSEDAIPLQRIFFDLDAYVPFVAREFVERQAKRPLRSLPLGESKRVPMVRYLISDGAPDRAVIVGGPGEGKSTIGQYMAQLHRATLLDKQDEMAISPDYVPETPRIPFRVALKDFAQWLADKSSESPEGSSLDTYIVENVTRVSTHEFSEKDLHEVLKTDPVLLILDGLDEVTDATVRRRLLTRILEFLERSQNSLHSNVQVIATTRPTNYNDHFDPKAFLHFRLHKLQAAQVRDYVNKWTVARVLEDDKASRLQRTIEECLADKQINLLMTTPLQVTILILIINSGGTPPRQREALFNEYLEVIYKREKAKGLGIVRTEKELLIGLHKFVGYLLHEEATRGRTSSATLSRTGYDALVLDYLRSHDPYSPEADIRAEWTAITVDAGERLVLIVESRADFFGFELRSIQEFFAACYLCDTSSDTTERYRRFASIASLPHWRNVALFFAGRVGRNYPGEAAFIIEACKQIDRNGPDLFVRRGAEAALELAAERALGPNRVLQRSLLEHGLGIFDIPMRFSTRRAVIELVKRLPYEDIRDHVLPVMEQRLRTLGYAPIVNACYLLGAVAPSSEVLARNLMRLASEASAKFADDILTVVSDAQIPSGLRIQVIRALLAARVNPSSIGQQLALAQWPALCHIAAELDSSDLDPGISQSFASHAGISGIHAARNSADSASLPDGNSLLAVVLACTKAIGLATAVARPSTPTDTRGEALRRELSSELPDVVISGDFSAFEAVADASWLLWLTHLALGNLTAESWERFVGWASSHMLSDPSADVWRYVSYQLCPIASSVNPEGYDLTNLRSLGAAAAEFGGVTGYQNWKVRVAQLLEQLSWLRISDLRKLNLFGPGVFPPPVRDQIQAILDMLFESRLQPIALNSLEVQRTVPRLNSEEFDSLSEWFMNLPTNSPWRKRSLAVRAASRAVSLKKICTSQFRVFSPFLSRFSLINFAIDAVLSEDSDAVRLLLSQLSSIADSDEYGSINIPSGKRRKTILGLLPFASDEGSDLREAALDLITELCYTAFEDDSPRSAIRSRELDIVHERLISSSAEVDRRTGLALYAVRPPRSESDWITFASLLRSATPDEVQDWLWILELITELVVDPTNCVTYITSVLQDGVEESLEGGLIGVLRKVLPRGSQSISRMSEELSLPAANY